MDEESEITLYLRRLHDRAMDLDRTLCAINFRVPNPNWAVYLKQFALLQTQFRLLLENMYEPAGLSFTRSAVFQPLVPNYDPGHTLRSKPIEAMEQAQQQARVVFQRLQDQQRQHESFELDMPFTSEGDLLTLPGITARMDNFNSMVVSTAEMARSLAHTRAEPSTPHSDTESIGNAAPPKPDAKLQAELNELLLMPFTGRRLH